MAPLDSAKGKAFFTSAMDHFLGKWSPSLAPLRFQRVMKSQGGPLLALSHRKAERLGEDCYEAFASLDAERTQYRAESSSLYGNWAGTGTAKTKAEAIYRAASEAMERWAWHESAAEWRAHPFSDPLAFHLDSGTTGFAAYPGWNGAAARPFALSEAAERWSIRSWWEQKLRHRELKDGLRWPRVEGLEIITPITRQKVAVLWMEEKGDTAFGFAAAPSLTRAVEKAAVELGRNLQVLGFSRESPVAPSSRNEKRLLSFARGEGKRAFLSRCKRADPVVVQKHRPKLLVDQEVKGPWTAYAPVWRCLFDPTGLADNGADDYFYF
jgi:hypothetical protein